MQSPIRRINRHTPLPVYSPVSDIIDRHPVTVAPNTPVMEALALANAARSSCVLVTEGLRLVGMLTQVEAQADTEVLSFSITDTGIGIAPENMSKLFKSFVQVDSSLSRRYEGTGLGLALVRRIVELHEGSVRVESELG